MKDFTIFDKDTGEIEWSGVISDSGDVQAQVVENNHDVVPLPSDPSTHYVDVTTRTIKDKPDVDRS